MRWRQAKWTNLILRLIGLALLCLAVLIGRRLFAVPNAHAKERPLVYLLAAAGMASACGGAVLTVIGRHLLDPGHPLPARRRRPQAHRQAPSFCKLTRAKSPARSVPCFTG